MNLANIKNTLAIIILIAFTSLIGVELLNTNNIVVEGNITNKESLENKNITEKDIYNKYVFDNKDTLVFLANTFQIKYEDLIDNLNNDYKSINLLESNNKEKTIISYLFKLQSKNKKLFDTSRKSCQDSKEYMLGLIKYFTNIYDNVDFEVAAAIADVESNFKSKSMLKANNIYGGLSNGKLIKYRNIEYGILKYIKLLNDGYYKKGLNTIEKIGKKYNPIIINGKKEAKPKWVSNVNKATKKYNEYKEIDIKELISLKK